MTKVGANAFRRKFAHVSARSRAFRHAPHLAGLSALNDLARRCSADGEVPVYGPAVSITVGTPQ